MVAPNADMSASFTHNCNCQFSINCDTRSQWQAKRRSIDRLSDTKMGDAGKLEHATIYNVLFLPIYIVNL